MTESQHSENKSLPQVTNFLEKKTEIAEQGRELPKLEEFKKIPEEFAPILEKLTELSRTWNPVEFITPPKDVLAREKAQFFDARAQGQAYNPQFEYSGSELMKLDSERATQVLERVLHEIQAFEPKGRAEQVAKIALYYKVRDDLATAQLAQGLKEKSDQKIKIALSKKYAQTDPELMATAEKIYKERITPADQPTPENQSEQPQPLLSEDQHKLLKDTELTAEETEEAFQWMMREYGFLRENGQDGFATKITDEVSYIDVRDKGAEPMTIQIPKERKVAKMTGIKLLQLMYHEIEGHVRQSMNGKRLMIGGGELRIDEEVLYEGLAKRLDERFHREFLGEREGEPESFYAFAVNMAENGKSFAEIYEDQHTRILHDELNIPLEQELPKPEEIAADVSQEAKEKAWKITYRVMRGHIDTTNKEGYAFAKDLAYLRGYLLDQQLVENGLGHINELAVMQTNALQLVAEIDFEEKDLPFPFKDLTKRYCFEVLLPKLEAQQQSQSEQTEN